MSGRRVLLAVGGLSVLALVLFVLPSYLVDSAGSETVANVEKEVRATPPAGANRNPPDCGPPCDVPNSEPRRKHHRAVRQGCRTGSSLPPCSRMFNSGSQPAWPEPARGVCWRFERRRTIDSSWRFPCSAPMPMLTLAPNRKGIRARFINYIHAIYSKHETSRPFSWG
jgi:hypothetical protein